MSTRILLFAAISLAFLQPSLTTRTLTILAQQPASQPKVSEAEAKALNAINAAPDAAAKLTGAEEFVKKYPKSAALPQLSEQIAIEISKVSDSNQKVALADRFEKAFTNEPALVIVRSAKLDACVAAHRADDAFTLAGAILAKDPEDVHTLVQMTITGTDEAKKGNGKYIAQSQQYGTKAIELIEANKKPASMDENTWANHKATLPILYQQTAILSVISKDTEDAKTRIAKAIALKPDDPSSHALMGYIVNNEYVALAGTYKTLSDGKAKEEMLKKLEGMIDTIIDSYAHVVGLASGRPEYQAMQQQVLPDLTSYYKYRHNQSVDGLQQLIDKYKPQGSPKP